MSESAPTRLNIAVRRDLHRRLKVRSASEGKSLVDLTEQLIAFGLANKKDTKRQS